MVQNYEFDACLAFLSLIDASYSSSLLLRVQMSHQELKKYGYKLHVFHYNYPGPKPLTSLLSAQFAPTSSCHFKWPLNITEHVVQEHKIPAEKHSTFNIQFSVIKF